MYYFVISMIFWTVISPVIALAAEDGHAIEIFVGGKKYDSLKIYHQEEQQVENSSRSSQDELVPLVKDNAEIKGMFDRAVKLSGRPLDLKFEPDKIKTIYIHPKAGRENNTLTASSNGTSFANDNFTGSNMILTQLGFNEGVHQVVSEFSLNRTWKGKPVNSENFEKILSDTFEGAKGPLLLISDRNKLRLMKLDADKQIFDEEHGSTP